MIVNIDVGGRAIPFRLDRAHWRWHAMEQLAEGDFPLIVVLDSRRYELYSDGTFGEVAK